jgi:hypothetical protein
MTQTFWLEPTDDVAVGLRRYSSTGNGFTCAEGYHSALVYTGQEPAIYTESDGYRHLAIRPDVEHDDPAWPTECEKGCGYAFTDEDHWQSWQELLYRRTDTSELRVLHTGAPAPFAPAAEPGACWDAWWMPFSRGVDGIYLMVRLPDGHDWAVDSQASNCTRPGEPHHCWIRHGDPRECHVTVDKNGDTCSAGAGSIGSPNWHGFLRDGQLVP